MDAEREVIKAQDRNNLQKNVKERSNLLAKQADLDNIKERKQYMEETYNEKNSKVEKLVKMVRND